MKGKQMDNNKIPVSVASAAPAEIILSGKKFLVSPATDKDFGELERWVQDRILDVCFRNANKLDNSADRQEFLKHAFDKASGTILASSEATVLLLSVEGAVMRLYLGIRHNHPDITVDEVRKLATSREEIEKAMLTVGFLDNPDTEKISKKE
jgi:hypothetical protein